MPLEPYLRAGKWWAKGRVDYNGQPITGYYRCSTGALTEQAAWQWISEEEERQRRFHLLGPEAEVEDNHPLTFADACLLYDANAKTAAYLIPILDKIGDQPLTEITPKIIRDLGKELYPDDSTHTWTRQVITPCRAVINNAHDLGKCAPIRIRGYTRDERTRQDKQRGSTGRRRYPPGSWEWLLQFREHADKRVAALALTMFSTGARISQAIQMTPHEHLKLDENKICIPGAKGLDDRWIDVPEWLVTELRELGDLWPRGWEHRPEYRRVFGYADRSSPRKHWDKAIEKAKIERLPFHAAGRHGFGQELNVRNPVDEKAASTFGGWSDISLMKKTYTHAETISEKIHAAQKAGLSQAEAKTKIPLRKAR